MATHVLEVRVTGDVSGLTRSMATGAQSVQSFESRMAATARSVDTHGRSLSGFGAKAVAVGTAIGGMAATAGAGLLAAAGNALMFGVKTASGLEQARIAFTTMLGSAGKADTMLRQLQDFAKSTPFEFPELVTASQRLLAMGFSAQQVIPTLTAIGDAAAGLGIGAEGVNRIVLAFGQMQAKGKVAGDELLQLTEAGIPALQILADHFHVSTGEMQNMVSKGSVPAKEAIAALTVGLEQGTEHTAKFGGMMARQSHTLSGVVSNLKDALGQGLAAAIAPVLPILERNIPSATAAAQQGLGALGRAAAAYLPPLAALLGNVMSRLAPFAQALGQVAANVVGILGNLAREAGPAVGALAAIAGTGVVGVFTALAKAVAGVTGFLRDHQVVAATLASVYAATLTPAIARAGVVIAANLRALAAYTVIQARAAISGIAGAFTGLGTAAGLASVAMAGVTFGISAAVLGFGAWANSVRSAGAAAEKTAQQIASMANPNTARSYIDLNRSFVEARTKLEDLAAASKRTADAQLVLPWNADKASAAYKRQQAALQELDRQHASAISNIDRLSQEFSLNRDQVMKLAQAAGIDLAGSFKNVHGAFAAIPEVADRASGASNSLRGALSGVKSQAGLTQDEIKKLTDALSGLINKNADAITSLDNFRLGLLDLRGGLDKSTRSIDGFSRGAITNREKLVDLVKQLGNTYEATLRQTGSQQKANDVLATGRTRLINAATAAGVDRDAVIRLVDQILGGQVPAHDKANSRLATNKDRLEKAAQAAGLTRGQIDKLSASLQTETGRHDSANGRLSVSKDRLEKAAQAAGLNRSQIDKLNQSLNNMPASKQTSIVMKVSAPTQVKVPLFPEIGSAGFGTFIHAEGHVVDYYAAGGVRTRPVGGSEQHIAQIAPAGAMRVWAEPETGGEAYIPLSPAKRSRSVEIWKETGRRLGLEVGGVVDGFHAAAGGILDGFKPPDIVLDMPPLPMKALQKWAEANFTPAVGSSSGPYMNWQQMWAIVHQHFPSAQLHSGLRPGAKVHGSGKTSLHALGQAIDVTPSMAIFNWLATVYRNSKEIIFSPAGGRQIYHGAPHMYGEPTRSDHFDHVHWGGAPAPGGGGGSIGYSPTGGGGSNRTLGRALLNARGWGAYWGALDQLWTHESGWNNNAQNPSSTAYGIPQFLNSTWGGTGYRKTSDPRSQILAGLNYIAHTYGNPAKAWSFWQGHHWYDQGGILQPGTTTVTNNTGQPERVLTASQWELIGRQIAVSNDVLAALKDLRKAVDSLTEKIDNLDLSSGGSTSGGDTSTPADTGSTTPSSSKAWAPTAASYDPGKLSKTQLAAAMKAGYFNVNNDRVNRIYAPKGSKQYGAAAAEIHNRWIEGGLHPYGPLGSGQHELLTSWTTAQQEKQLTQQGWRTTGNLIKQPGYDPTVNQYDMRRLTDWDIRNLYRLGWTVDPTSPIPMLYRPGTRTVFWAKNAYPPVKQYDGGGWLQPGMTMAVNASGQPERVVTGTEWRAVQAKAAGNVTVEAGAVQVSLVGTTVTPRDVEQSVSRAFTEFTRQLKIGAGGG